MAPKYKLNYEAFGRQVLKSEAMQAHMRARAEKIKDQFVATAPVGSPSESDDHPGRYRDSARVESGVAIPSHGRGERAYGRVVVDDPAAMSIEYGHTAEFDEQGRFAKRGTGVRSQFIDGSHTLTNALDAAGDA